MNIEWPRLYYKDPRTIAYLKTLREAQTAKLQHTMQPFEDLAPEAQQTVLQVMRGECRSRMRFEGALHILDRALGKPVQRAETEFSLNPRVTSCVQQNISPMFSNMSSRCQYIRNYGPHIAWIMQYKPLSQFGLGR